MHLIAFWQGFVCLLFGWLILIPQGVVADRPNILFLLTDDQRGDTIAAFGNGRIETPHLDALVRRGLTFTRATCSYPICFVSRAEILSGRHGWQNGVDGLGSNQPRSDLVYWADAFQSAGYQTGYVGKWHTRGRPDDYGFAEAFGLFSSGGGQWHEPGQTDWKGFEITGYRGWVFQSLDGRQKFPEKGVGLTPDIDTRFADAAMEAIDKFSQTPAPWFLHVNFTAPHDPLLMPPELEGKYAAEKMQLPANFLSEHPFDHGNLRGRDESLMDFPRTEAQTRDVLRVYYSVIDHLDRQIGRIIEQLKSSGEFDNTLIIFSSDHGMGVGSHGLRGKQNMYEHTINVPLVIAGPGIPSGERTDAQVYLRELYPTTCELSDVPIPPTVQAKSFAAVARGETDAHHEAIFGYFTDAQRMIRRDGWKYIEYPQADRTQLFSLDDDPFERENLTDSTEHAAVRRALAEELQQWRERNGDPMLER